jgi:hypothetical protein
VRRLNSPFEGNVDVGYCISGSVFRCMNGHYWQRTPRAVFASTALHEERMHGVHGPLVL